MSELLKINVNEHTERKGQLRYLSWSWAWAEVLKIDPAATWVVHNYGPQGSEQPCMWIGETAMVHTSVTVNGLRRECMLPVMDNRNNAVKLPDARKISDAIMRCMTKAISMHGLGLYIYAGEDLPEAEAEERQEHPADPIPESFRSSPTMGAMNLIEDDRKMYLELLATIVIAKVKAGEVEFAHEKIVKEKFDSDETTALWSLLDSKTRSALKKHVAELKARVPA